MVQNSRMNEGDKSWLKALLDKHDRYLKFEVWVFWDGIFVPFAYKNITVPTNILT